MGPSFSSIEVGEMPSIGGEEEPSVYLSVVKSLATPVSAIRSYFTCCRFAARSIDDLSESKGIIGPLTASPFGR